MTITPVKHKSISINISIENNEAFATLESQNTKKPIKFLVDSGASLSFISADLIKIGTRVDRNATVNVTSATGHCATTVAMIKDTLIIGETNIQHEFHIFDQNIPINADGILGLDFFIQFKGILDISSLLLNLTVPVHTTDSQNAENASPEKVHTNANTRVTNNKYIFPFDNCENEIFADISNIRSNSNVRKNYFDFPEKKFPTKANTVPFFSASKMHSYLNLIENVFFSQDNVVPERSLKWAKIKTSLVDGDFVINHTEILPNIFTLSAIIHVENNHALVPIINKNDFPFLIPDKYMNANFFDDTSKYNVYHMHTTTEDRSTYIIEHVNIGQGDTDIQCAIKKLCIEFSDIFFVNGDKISHTDILTHTITLKPDAKSAFTKQYRIPESQKIELQRQLCIMEKEGVIEKCTASGWNSPIILVPKKDADGHKKDFRVVVDFRKLNDSTIPIQFPIPQIDSIIDRLTHSKFFTTLDLHGAFHQIKLDEKSRNFTTFQNEHFYTGLYPCHRACTRPLQPCRMRSTSYSAIY